MVRVGGALSRANGLQNWRDPKMIPPDNPSGEYVADPDPSIDRQSELILEIERFPVRLRRLITGLAEDHLSTKYKNWTIRQIVHHLADSHVNAYVRTKLALTEDCPTIKPYDETQWSNLPDACTAEVESSLRLLDGVHARWATTWRSMTSAHFTRTYLHPEFGKVFRLDEVLGLYAWHGRHHGAMIAWLRRQHGWGPFDNEP
jgi:DinB superfamily